MIRLHYQARSSPSIEASCIIKQESVPAITFHNQTDAVSTSRRAQRHRLCCGDLGASRHLRGGPSASTSGGGDIEGKKERPASHSRNLPAAMAGHTGCLPAAWSGGCTPSSQARFTRHIPQKTKTLSERSGSVLVCTGIVSSCGSPSGGWNNREG